MRCPTLFVFTLLLYIISSVEAQSRDRKEYSRYGGNKLYSARFFKDWADSPLTSALDDVLTFSFYSFNSLRLILKETLVVIRNVFLIPDRLFNPFWRAVYFAMSPLFHFMYIRHPSRTVRSHPLLMLPPPSCNSTDPSCYARTNKAASKYILSIVYKIVTVIPRPVYSILLLISCTLFLKTSNSGLAEFIRQSYPVSIIRSKKRFCIFMFTIGVLVMMRPVVNALVDLLQLLLATVQSLLTLAIFSALYVSVPIILISVIYFICIQS